MSRGCRVMLASLVAVFVTAATCLAGAMYRNDSGTVARAVRIEFSEPAEITSMWPSFPQRDPQGPAKVIVLSGGEVTAGGWFSFTWRPDSARVVKIEWMARLGPTFEEIMAAIARYPAEDEPLYQPGPEEAIWLTDLEGHAEIYDNDSIRINYAPWFDQSQITRIEVYRNGVRMRFLPDRFDVLTNEQMKTFDGNPPEHTPASKHTDHVIFGYSYELRFFGQGGVFVTSLGRRILNPYRFSGTRIVNIGQAYDALEELTDAQLLERLTLIREMGFERVQFSVAYYVDSLQATSIFPAYTYDSPAVSWSRTMTGTEIARLLDLIGAAGLSSEVRLELWVDYSHRWERPDLPEADRGELRPADIGKWFSIYRNVLVPLAQLVEAHGGDVLCLAVELNSLNKYRDEWEALAAEVRQHFSGEITIAESTGVFVALENCGVQSFASLAGRYWEAYDFISMNQWPLVCLELETQLDQRFSAILERFMAHWSKPFAFYRRQFPEVPLVFGEIGTYNFDGAAAVKGLRYYMSWLGSPDVTPDKQEAADIWGAMLLGAIALGADGIAIWSVVLNVPDRAPLGPPSGWFDRAGDHRLNIWPALEVILSFFSDKPRPFGVGLPIADQVDWGAVPQVFSYRAPTPITVFIDGQQRSLKEASHWGNTGHMVSSLKLGLYEDALAIRVDLDQSDSVGRYRYLVCLYYPHGGRLVIVLDPYNTSADVANDAAGTWTWIAHVSGALYGSTERSVYAVIPLADLEGFASRETLRRSRIADFHLDWNEGGHREVFLLPGSAFPVPVDEAILREDR